MTGKVKLSPIRLSGIFVHVMAWVRAVHMYIQTDSNIRRISLLMDLLLYYGEVVVNLNLSFDHIL